MNTKTLVWVALLILGVSGAANAAVFWEAFATDTGAAGGHYLGSPSWLNGTSATTITVNASRCIIGGVIYIKNKVGAPGFLNLSVESDSAGVPSNTLYTASTNVAGNSSPGASTWYSLNFTNSTYMPAGNAWLVWKTATVPAAGKYYTIVYDVLAGKTWAYTAGGAWIANAGNAEVGGVYWGDGADCFGSETQYLTLTINSPTNTTYGTSPTFANASFTSNNASTANCTRYLDGVLFNSTIENNATQYYDSITSGVGTHNYTVHCENATLGISDWDAAYYTVGYALNLTVGCTPVALSFNFYNEETLFDANASMDATFHLTSGTGINNTFYGNWTNQHTIDVCLTGGATATIDSFQIYYAEGYNQRAYFLTHATITNASHANVSLYMSNTTLNKVTYFALTDDNNLPLDDYYITALRYYPALNQYYGVAMVLTDNNGEANTYLTPNDIWYKFLVTQMDGTVIELFTPARTIFCDPSAYSCNVELNVGGQIVGEYWQYHGQVAHSCTYDNVTRYLTCTVTDASGVLNSFTLTTYKVGAYANTTDCYQALNASTGTLSCYITNTTQEVTWLLTGWGSEYYLGSGSFYTTSTPYGDIGLFAAFAVFAALTFLGAAVSPGLSIALGLLALGVTRWLQLYDVSYGALGAIVIVGLIFVWRLRQ